MRPARLHCGRCLPRLPLLLLALLLVSPLRAEIRMSGDFTAEQSCPALVSIRKQTNPGKVSLTPDREYSLLAANAEPATYYRLRVPGARPRERWVEASCGYLGKRKRSAGAGAARPGQGPEYVLALSWQPAFCQMRRGKSECRNQHPQRFDADHFTLHGLWPQPRSNVYCGVSNHQRKRNWRSIPALELSKQTRAALDRAMPGTESYLQRHQWLKHGTCYGKPAEPYFLDAMALMKQVNQSAIQKLFADNIGSRITAAEIRAAADQSFGRDAGTRIVINCRSGMITELQFQLRGTIERDTPLGDLLRAATPGPLRCSAGRVDRVGY